MGVKFTKIETKHALEDIVENIDFAKEARVLHPEEIREKPWNYAPKIASVQHRLYGKNLTDNIVYGRIQQNEDQVLRDNGSFDYYVLQIVDEDLQSHTVAATSIKEYGQYVDNLTIDQPMSPDHLYITGSDDENIYNIQRRGDMFNGGHNKAEVKGLVRRSSINGTSLSGYNIGRTLSRLAVEDYQRRNPDIMLCRFGIGEYVQDLPPPRDLQQVHNLAGHIEKSGTSQITTEDLETFGLPTTLPVTHWKYSAAAMVEAKSQGFTVVGAKLPPTNRSLLGPMLVPSIYAKENNLHPMTLAVPQSGKPDESNYKYYT